MAAKKQQGEVLEQAALALRPKEVTQLSFDPLTAKAAAKKGLAAIAKRRAELKKKYPGIALSELDALPELADRIAAQQRVVQRASAAGNVAELLPVTASWRRRLLALAQALAESGAVEAKALAAIEKGTGPGDLVRDVSDLVQLLTPVRAKVEAFAGAGALTTAKAAADAAIAALGGGAANVEQVADARDLRDRYASVFAARHDRLRAAAAVLFGYREAAALVPSIVDGSARKKTEPTPPAAAT